MRRMIGLLLLLGAIPAFAGDDCEDVFERQVAHDLQALPPLILDTPTISEAIRGLVGQLKEIQPELKEIRGLGQSLLDGTTTPQEVGKKAQALRKQAAEKGQELLQRPTMSRDERRLAEGYKILLNQSNRLLHRAQEIGKNPELLNEEEEDSSPQGDSGDQNGQGQQGQKQKSPQQKSPPQNGQQQKSPPQNGQQQQQKSPQQNGQRQKSPPQNHQKQSDQKQSGEKSDGDEHGEESSQKSSDQKSGDSKQNESKQNGDKQKQSGEKGEKADPQDGGDKGDDPDGSSEDMKPSSMSQAAESKPDEKSQKGQGKKDKGQQPGKKGEGDKGEGQEGEQGQGEGQDGEGEQGEGQGEKGEGQKGQGEGQEGEGQEGEGQSQGEGQGEGEGQGQKSKAKSKGQQQGEGQEGEGEGEGEDGSGDGQGSASQKPGESRAGGKNPKGGDAQGGGYDSGEQRDAESIQDGPGSDGLNEGGMRGGQSIASRLADFFKDLLEKSEKEGPAELPDVKPWGDDEAPTRESASRESKSSRSPTERKESASSPSRYLEDEEALKKRSEGKPIPRGEPWKRPQPRDLRERKKAKNLSSTEQAILTKAALEKLWIETLTRYDSGKGLLDALKSFQDICDHLNQTTGDTSYAQYSQRAFALRETLEIFEVEYKTLEDLGLSMIGGLDSSSRNLLRKLSFLDKVLEELSKARSLTADETEVQSSVRSLLRFLSGKGSIEDDARLGKAFLEQLGGPLSRKVLRAGYASDRPGEDYDWRKLAADIRAGKLNDLLIYGRLKPYTNILLQQTMTPKLRLENTGDKVVVNENEPELDLAEDLSRFAHFQRDGSPTDVDLMRFLSGDMLENIYREPVTKSDPRKPQPRKVTIILYDISGSMGGSGKHVLRNALIGSYVDRSQIEVANGKAEHVVYTMAFDGAPKPPERLGSLTNAQAFFDRLRSSPITYGGDDSITAAVEKVYQIINEHNSSGNGSLDRANILLLTDAVAPVDFPRIQRARDAIQGDVEIVFNAITMGDLNSDVQQLVAMQGGEGEGKLGRVYHQHIDYDSVGKLLNANARLESLKASAASFDTDGEGSLSKDALVKFKNRLMSLVSRREIDESVTTLRVNDMGTRLGEASGSHNSELSEAFQPILKGILGPIGKGWSLNKKLIVLHGFMEAFAKQLQVEPDQVLEDLSAEQKVSLRKWLGVDY